MYLVFLAINYQKCHTVNDTTELSFMRFNLSTLFVHSKYWYQRSWMISTAWEMYLGNQSFKLMSNASEARKVDYLKNCLEHKLKLPYVSSDVYRQQNFIYLNLLGNVYLSLREPTVKSLYDGPNSYFCFHCLLKCMYMTVT